MSEPQELGAWVSAKRAAEVLGLSVRRIQQLCKAKELGSRLVNQRWFVHVSSLKRYQAEHPK